MVRHGHIVESYAFSSPLQRLRRHTRSVQVKVIEEGREVDSFQVTDPQVLRAEIRSIYRHIPRGDAVVRLSGVHEEWLPLGIDRVRREMELGNVADALFFLAA